MTINVELLDQSGQVVSAPRPIIEVARPFLDQSFGPNWAQADKPMLLLWPYRWENNHIGTNPPLAYLTELIGFIQVRVIFGGRVLYRHPHTVADVLTPGLQQWLAELGDTTYASAYRITSPDIELLLQRATPVPRWVTEVTPYAPGEQPAFRIRPIPPQPPAVATLADFGAIEPDADWLQQAGHTDFVKLLVDRKPHDELLHRRPLSAEVEEGGFLIGQVYQDRDQPGTHLVHLVDAIPAEEVGASFLHFTFTGDSFDRVKQRLAQEHREQRLLGWFHTHLFPASETMGLSSIDLHLHFTTFRIDWQIAGLLNLDGEQRVLRFYVRRENTMALCHHQVIDR